MKNRKIMSLRNSRFNCGIILLAGIFYKLIIVSIAVTMPNKGIHTKDIGRFSARGVGQMFANCLAGTEITSCLKNQLLNVLETAAQDNSTWHYNDILSFEKTLPQTTNQSLMYFQRHRRERSFGDSLAERVLQLAQTRSLRLTLPKELSRLAGISDAVDDVLNSSPVQLTSFSEEGTVRVFNGLIDDKIEAISNSGQKKYKKMKDKKKDKDENKNKIWYFNYKNPLKGRKKKDKDKNMAMMGGMVMMAMIAQMFLGKVILIAGAAFIMAKIALLISVLGSLKKGSSGSSGSATEHVIISGGGGGHGGHSHESGWHRSMPFDYTKFETHKPAHPSVSGPPISDEELSNAGPPPTTGFQPHYDAHGMPGFL